MVSLELLQGNFKDGAAVAGEGPAPHPAAVVAVINANHLVRVRIAHEGDAIALMEGAN